MAYRFRMFWSNFSELEFLHSSRLQDLRTYIHILLHIESLTTTRPGVLFFFGCPLLAYFYADEDALLKTTNPPKIYFRWNILLLLCNLSSLAKIDLMRTIISFSFLANLQSRKIDSRVNNKAHENKPYDDLHLEHF